MTYATGERRKSEYVTSLFRRDLLPSGVTGNAEALAWGAGERFGMADCIANTLEVRPQPDQPARACAHERLTKYNRFDTEWWEIHLKVLHCRHKVNEQFIHPHLIFVTNVALVSNA